MPPVQQEQNSTPIVERGDLTTIPEAPKIHVKANALNNEDPYLRVEDYGENYRIVRGGKVITEDGTYKETIGLFATAIEQEKVASLPDKEFAQILEEEKDDYGNSSFMFGMHRVASRAERITAAKLKEVEGEKRREIQKAETERQKAVDRLERLAKVLTPGQRDNFDAVMIIEDNKSNLDNSDVQAALKTLGYTDEELQINSPEQRLKLEGAILATIKMVPQMSEGKYGTYKNAVLEIKQKVGEVDAIDNLYVDRIAQAQQAKDEAEKKAKEWADNHTKFKKELSPKQREMEARWQLYEQVGKFLDVAYIPSAKEVEDLMKESGDLLIQKDKAQTRYDTIKSLLSDKDYASHQKKFSEMLENEEKTIRELGIKIIDVRDQLTANLDPAARLKRQGAPQVFIAAVEAVDKDDFNLENIPQEQQTLYKAAMLLLGKGEVSVYEATENPVVSAPPVESSNGQTRIHGSSTVEQLRNSSARQDLSESEEILMHPDTLAPIIPLPNGLSNDESSNGQVLTESNDNKDYTALTIEQLNGLPKDELATAMYKGELTKDQLSSLVVHQLSDPNHREHVELLKSIISLFNEEVGDPSFSKIQEKVDAEFNKYLGEHPELNNDEFLSQLEIMGYLGGFINIEKMLDPTVKASPIEVNNRLSAIVNDANQPEDMRNKAKAGMNLIQIAAITHVYRKNM